MCQGLKSKLIWLHSHSEPQTQFCRLSESVKRPPKAWSGHMQRGHSLSIRLLLILWQINLEPKQRRVFDIPSTQQYMRCKTCWKFHYSPDQLLHPNWTNERRCKTVVVDMLLQGTGWCLHSYCSDAGGGQQESGFIRIHPGLWSSWKQMGFFLKSH